ncbi:type IX secretion system membrane protein PorP/SprF [Pedobacter sp. SD-b]|uniref:Type IX secretion system membrane protein PorP/SprF n=1 Tax=Pedobacter segetis TaxID=2793069 RepID=A0ABS1BGE5_9SPHI|nr:type IX secretion system membrane protein PorP/SprF [Pedobacter segetis]MBK0381918.1 type IX secretion system membrane protein PorP/SprF [Pedobacter segetis]
MRRLIFILFVLFGVLKSSLAQQKPQYTQYILNNFIINPAISGIENYIDVKAATRQQWAGLENAPQTSYLTAHMPLGNTNDWGSATSYGMVGDNPLGRSYKSDYEASKSHSGIGLIAVVDKTGPLSNNSFNLTYAYHIGLAPRLNLAVGVGAGISKVTLNTNDITLENPNDAAIANSGNINRIKPDLNVGIWLYSAEFFFGASVQQILPQTLSFSDQSSYNQGKTVPHSFFTAGYRFWLSDDVTVIPSIMVKYVNPVPLGIDFNTKVAFRDKFWVGGAYRKDDSYSGMVGFNLGSLINVGYAYDFTQSALNTVSRGSHEIVIGLTLNNHYKVTCPQKLW